MLPLPAAHDALSARLIARAGFKAYQVAGFALAGARYAYPDIDHIHFYEENEAIPQIVAASTLPVLGTPETGSGTSRTSPAPYAFTKNSAPWPYSSRISSRR